MHYFQNQNNEVMDLETDSEGLKAGVNLPQESRIVEAKELFQHEALFHSDADNDSCEDSDYDCEEEKNEAFAFYDERAASLGIQLTDRQRERFWKMDKIDPGWANILIGALKDFDPFFGDNVTADCYGGKEMKAVVKCWFE